MAKMEGQEGCGCHEVMGDRGHPSPVKIDPSIPSVPKISQPFVGYFEVRSRCNFGVRHGSSGHKAEMSLCHKLL